MKYRKTRWHCCRPEQVTDLLNQGFRLPSTDLTDREIILWQIDDLARMGVQYLRDAQKKRDQFDYCYGHDSGAAWAYIYAACGLAEAAGIASSTYRSEERLKYFRERQSKLAAENAKAPLSPFAPVQNPQPTAA